MTIATTFTTTCPCGVTIDWIEGVEQPHDCAPIPPQAVRDAYAEGYGVALDMARKDAQRIVDLAAKVERLTAHLDRIKAAFARDYATEGDRMRAVAVALSPAPPTYAEQIARRDHA